jgi:hypothetical protein
MPTVAQGIQNLEKRMANPPEPPADEPVFIFSAGWRTGSTLLQRLVMSSGKVLVWGEPYTNCEIIRQLAGSLQAITPDFPPDRFFIKAHREQGLDFNAWVANLYPDPECFLQAHRAFFQSLFAGPALAESYPAWGVKVTRLEQAHAIYLKWLFPRAKFLYIYRNPYAAYQSFRPFRKQVWYAHWPNRPMLTSTAFGRHWRTLLAGFLAGYQEVGGRLIKYEDLCSGQLSIDSLEEYLQLRLDRAVLSVRVASRRPYSGQEPAVPAAELRLLRRAVDPLAAELGYTPE